MITFRSIPAPFEGRTVNHLEARWPDGYVVILPRLGEAVDDPTLRSALEARVERIRAEAA